MSWPRAASSKALSTKVFFTWPLDADLAKIARVDGLCFRISAYQIHGGRLSTSNIFNFATVDSIEARPTTRLFELWVEQKFNDVASIRIGQLAADNQFFISEFGYNLYINSTFGWPTIFAANLPSGGPAYPLATPPQSDPERPPRASRRLVRWRSLRSGVHGFAGDQGPGRNKLSLQGPATDGRSALHVQSTAQGLAGTIKLGAWYHFGTFDDVHFDLDGKSLADPSSCGVLRTHTGDYGVYGVVDQMLWRLPGDDPKKGFGAFARAFLSPSDRNLMDFYADAGLNFMGLRAYS
jgi:porin